MADFDVHHTAKNPEPSLVARVATAMQKPSTKFIGYPCRV